MLGRCTLEPPLITPYFDAQNCIRVVLAVILYIEEVGYFRMWKEKEERFSM